ncbi:MAG: hypothetical protein C0402_04410 [Thermodesulfovibrio sp.]|nr:hypothetical protein [Thermodesulfovibrio sp.]
MEPAGCIKTSGQASGQTSDSVSEIVICDGEAAAKAHRQLFTINEACYRMAGDDILGAAASSVTEDLTKLHIAAGWETMLKVALWTSRRPLLVDVLGLLKKNGIGETELLPFRNADINDIFPWLYYGKRFETLRKIANRARARAESVLEKKKLLVYCHLVAEDTGQIVASSL